MVLKCVFVNFYVLLGWFGWTEHRVQGYTYYDNVKSQGESRWSTPPNFQKDIGHLNRDEVQVWRNNQCFYDVMMFLLPL